MDSGFLYLFDGDPLRFFQVDVQLEQACPCFSDVFEASDRVDDLAYEFFAFSSLHEVKGKEAVIQHRDDQTDQEKNGANDGDVAQRIT